MTHIQSGYRLTVEEETRLREFITKLKDRYLESPTLVDARYEDGLRELPEKLVHSDWWHERTGGWNEDEWTWERYDHLLEWEVFRILVAREKPVDDWDFVRAVLPPVLMEFAIPGKPSLGDLDGEYEKELRAWIFSLPIEVVKRLLYDWFDCRSKKAFVRWSIAFSPELRKQIPIEFVFDYLEECEDVAESFGDLGILNDATYAHLVAFGRACLELPSDWPPDPEDEEQLGGETD
jgi:hypothetical protein